MQYAGGRKGRARLTPLALCMCVLLLACGPTTSAVQGVTPSPTPRDTPTPTLTPIPTLPATDNPALLDKEGTLSIYGALNCPAIIMLAPHAATYSDGELTDLISGLQAHGPLPSTLQRFHVGGGGLSCGGDLEVTYQGSSQVTISGIGVVIQAVAVPYAIPYRRLDTCSLTRQNLVQVNPDDFCPQRSAAPCAVTGKVAVGIDTGALGTNYITTFSSQDCPNPTLTPGATVDIDLDLSGAPSIYTIAPELIVSDGTGTHPVVFPALRDVLAFAQVQCYSLATGNSFVPSTPQDCAAGFN